MRIGTKSVLFGAHAFWLHPWFVALAWWRLYGFPWDPRLWLAFIVHDIGYWGKRDMDGRHEGELHPYPGARLMGFLFDRKHSSHRGYWYRMCVGHSRYLARRRGENFSRLCVADKLAIAITPTWLYVPMTRLTGEIVDYRASGDIGARDGHHDGTDWEWYNALRAKMEHWAYANRNSAWPHAAR